MACLDDDEIYAQQFQPKNQPKLLRIQPKILVLGKYHVSIQFLIN